MVQTWPVFFQKIAINILSFQWLNNLELGVADRGLRGAAAARTRGLLEILCAFQGAFVASGITVDESAEATERTAVEIEDAGPAQF